MRNSSEYTFLYLERLRTRVCYRAIYVPRVRENGSSVRIYDAIMPRGEEKQKQNKNIGRGCTRASTLLRLKVRSPDFRNNNTRRFR